ncbi:hypothetical protein [Tenacibaculum agarivorans]|uniref:hypothetical protein n=1 Tax=Tenacibaculum agarivorans TaxID=1908389 RepID=UPI00094BB33D|nr:hypothetical protein [Tenacibaculum agarivorans]
MKYLLFSFFVVSIISCTSSVVEPNNTSISENFVIWSGPNITFTKASGTNPTDPKNQDNITPSVSITRSTAGGQIFNIEQEDAASKEVSPRGTKWAVGNISDIPNLSFTTFRKAVGSPKDVVGKNLVMYIEEENVCVSVVFKTWNQNKNGGFSYERSTEN